MAIHLLVAHAFQRVGVQKAKVTSVDDGGGLVVANKAVELVVCAHGSEQNTQRR